MKHTEKSLSPTTENYGIPAFQTGSLATESTDIYIDPPKNCDLTLGMVA
jgi:hypothetical protein